MGGVAPGPAARGSGWTDLEEHVPTREEIDENLAEIREMITSGTREDHKT